MAASKKNALRGYSGEQQIARLLDYQKSLPPPPGYDFSDEFKSRRWREYLSARAPDQWNAADLVQIAELVLLDEEIAAKQAILNDEGDLVANRFGELAAHPYVAILRGLHTRRSVYTKILQYTVPPDTKAGAKKKALAAAQAKEMAKNQDDDGLLADFDGDDE